MGREDGALGYPMADEQSSTDGAIHSADVENGTSIWWTALTGAWPISGELKQMWTDSGGATGDYGVPTANPVQAAGGALTQFFQRGVLSIADAINAYGALYKEHPVAGPAPDDDALMSTEAPQADGRSAEQSEQPQN